jgi:hypothetical protein
VGEPVTGINTLAVIQGLTLLVFVEMGFLKANAFQKQGPAEIHLPLKRAT